MWWCGGVVVVVCVHPRDQGGLADTGRFSKFVGGFWPSWCVRPGTQHGGRASEPGQNVHLEDPEVMGGGAWQVVSCALDMQRQGWGSASFCRCSGELRACKSETGLRCPGARARRGVGGGRVAGWARVGAGHCSGGGGSSSADRAPGRPPWQERARRRSRGPSSMVRPCPSVGPRGRLRAWPGARELAPSLRTRPARCRRLLPRGGAEAGAGGGPGGAGGAAAKAGGGAGDMTDNIPLQPVRQKKRMDSRPRAG